MKITAINTMIHFDNGKALLDHHNSDCCEQHWAEFEQLKTYNISPTTGKEISIFDLDFDPETMIKPVEDLGFLLIATNGDKFLVPCYGENNGYYSTNLTLLYGTPEKCSFANFYWIPEADVYWDLTDCQDITWV